MNRERLETLITRWSDGSLGADEFRELETTLRADAEARHFFRQHANLDAGLREWAEERSAATPWPHAGETPVASPRPFGILLAAAAAVLLCAVGAWFWKTPRKASPPIASAERTAQGCAVLTQTLDAHFADASHASGETLVPGRIHLTGGWAQVEFFSGATMLVEGAAELEIVSSWEARCLSGRVRVRVPPAAHGFRLHAPGVQLVDLGTEFAVNADAGAQKSDVHVFEGEVIAHPNGAAQMSLRRGQSLRDAQLTELDPALFPGVGQLQELVSERQQQRLQKWQTWSDQARRDSRLIAFFPFLHSAKWERLVGNTAEPGDPAKNGGAVGVAWAQGRWPGKDALRFKRPGDRVRLRLDGTFDALTLTCWARVDSLDNKYNALLLTDGYDPGAPHWQIYEDGRLMFSLIYPDPQDPTKRRNQIYFSPAVFTTANLDRWHQLAVTYDNRTGETVQYFDGEPVSREVSPYHAPGRSLAFGPCEIGNWGLPTEGHKFPIRNLDGSIDEFAIYSARLTDAEIREQYEQGKPE